VTVAEDQRQTLDGEEPGGRAPWLRPPDLHALALWLLAHAGGYLIMVLAAPGRTTQPFWQRLTPWDAENFITIAQYGYDGSPGMQDADKLPACFPGMPLLLRVLDPFFADLRVATVLISLVAGAVAVVALSRISESIRPGSGIWTVAAFLLSPFAVFLFAGYSEALFLGLALPAWLLARRGRWELAVLCAAGASAVRITGLFLALALRVEFARTRPTLRRAVRQGPWLLVPFVPVAAYLGYQWARTGQMLAWKHAEEVYWGRSTVWPWEALRNTWNRSVETPSLMVSYREEIAAAAVLLAVTVWLLARRRWPEAAYMVPQALAFLTLSSFYMSVGRASLLWFPLWLMIGVTGPKRPWVYATVMTVMVPIMVLNVANFTTGAWTG
jgi:hypothetical protein